MKNFYDTIKQNVRIKLESEQSQDIVLSEQLALKMNLPAPSSLVGDVHCYFVYHNAHLQLFIQDNGEFLGPLVVDFLSGPVFYRYQNNRHINQPLARAAGIKKGLRPSICDVTAGLGGDSFVLAALGCHVTMTERSPLIWALLENGIKCALSHPEIGNIFKERVALHFDDGISFINSSDLKYDTIYLDPMYPQQKKSALNKLQMRLLRQLVGSDEDSTILLQEARANAGKRVVVKRPAGAPFLEQPSFVIKGKSSRFDVYLSPHL